MHGEYQCVISLSLLATTTSKEVHDVTSSNQMPDVTSAVSSAVTEYSDVNDVTTEMWFGKGWKLFLFVAINKGTSINL